MVEEVEEGLQSTIVELLRLQEHPELFPSKDVEDEFWQEVHSLCAVLLEDVLPCLKEHDKDRDLHAAAMDDENNDLLPGRDVQRKPWEQYLHNRAPGVGVDLSTYGPGGSTQVFPMPAMRIVMKYLEENRAVITDIESVSVNERSNGQEVRHGYFEG